MVLCLVGTILLAAAAGSIGDRLGRALMLISSLALCLFGIYQIWSGAGALL
jgi:hypothetical protein